MRGPDNCKFIILFENIKATSDLKEIPFMIINSIQVKKQDKN